MALKSLHLVNGKDWRANARLPAKLQDKISLECFRVGPEGSEGLELDILKFLSSFCIYDIIQETFKQPRWNAMSCQVVACDIYRQARLTKKDYRGPMHTNSCCHPPGPPRLAAAVGWVKKLKKKERG